MITKIITKFTVANEQGMEALLMLTKALALEKFSDIVPVRVLNKYIIESFSKATLIEEVNSMSNQWLVVYTDEKPAGYARITTKGKKPERLGQERTVRIADFGVLKKYKDPAIRQSLFAKCLSACKAYSAVWINEYAANPGIVFFENEGFIQEKEGAQLDELPWSSVYLIKKL